MSFLEFCVVLLGCRVRARTCWKWPWHPCTVNRQTELLGQFTQIISKLQSCLKSNFKNTSNLTVGFLMLNWKLLWKEINSFPSSPWKLVIFQPAQSVPCTASQTGWHKQGIMLEHKHPVAPSVAIFSVVSPAQNFHLKTAFVQICFRTDFVFSIFWQITPSLINFSSCPG